jgi:hypothetical protein
VNIDGENSWLNLVIFIVVPTVDKIETVKTPVIENFKLFGSEIQNWLVFADRYAKVWHINDKSMPG